jgi:glutamate-1-semialdehyde 2,1-aminomutase
MLEKYRRNTSGSRQLFDRAQHLFAGGVNHNLRTFGMAHSGAYPPFMRKGSGSHIWDVDGNEYIDWWMVHYSAILGHNHPKVIKAIRAQLENGCHFGTLNEAQIEFGERLQKAIPALAKMRFCSTGSESTMYAVRLARLYTKRPLVAKALGGWHGGNDALGYHLKYPFNDGPFFNGVSFDFNDRDSVDVMMTKYGQDLAAVIVEPVLGAGGGLPPESGFLPYLREETQKRGILLILDEIVTGFRLRYGSAGKTIFGVEPDLMTLGKIVAGGMPLAVYGGREEVMSLAAPGASGGRWVGGGTFSDHPLSMAAGVATLDVLLSIKDEYATLNSTGDRFRKRVNDMFEQDKVSALATGFGSIAFIHWLKHEAPGLPLTGRKIGEAIDYDGLELFQGLLLEQGVLGYHGLGALSFVHPKKDLDNTLSAISVVAKQMKKLQTSREDKLFP